MKQKINQTNPFLALAQALWERGDDGQVIATDLAEAFRTIVTEGTGSNELEEHKQELENLTAHINFD